MQFLFFLIFSLLTSVTAELIDDLILSFLLSKGASSLIYFTCLQKDVVRFTKHMSSAGVRMQACQPQETVNLSSALSAYSSPLGVVLDMSCPHSVQLVAKAAELGVHGGLRHWLLLMAGSSGADDDASLAGTVLPVDSNVVLAWLGAGRDAAVWVRDGYSVSDDLPLVLTEPRAWLRGATFPPGPSRLDWQGIVLKAGFAMPEYHRWENLYDMQERYINTWSKAAYVLVDLVSQMLNFTMNITVIHSCGYLDKHGAWSDMVDWLVNGEGEICVGACIMTKLRTYIIDYTAEILQWSPRFIFREPSLSSVCNIYMLPFDNKLWVTYLSMVMVLTGILHTTCRLDHSLSARPEQQDHVSDWAESLSRSLGLVCQQGWPDTPDNITARIIFLFFFLTSTFTFTAYSAIIVSLLQSPSSSINSLEDLVAGPLKIAFHDTVYNYHLDNFINFSTVPVAGKLLQEKVRHRSGIYLEQIYGLELVRHGEVALHVDDSAYQIISDMWQEYDKCNLKELHFFSRLFFVPSVKKRSPYREIITQKLRWLREVGLLERERKRWLVGKPSCASSGAVFVSVGLQEFGPALGALLYGYAFSIAIFVMELLWRRARCLALAPLCITYAR